MTSKTILIVDDDQDLAESIALHCRHCGWTAETVATPLAAVNRMIVNPPDLVCLDVGLPTGNGLDLCEYVVRQTKGRNTPVIIVTGRSDEETLVRARGLGTRYVRKSTDLWPQLHRAIAELA